MMGARLVDDADRRLFQRHIHPGIILHGRTFSTLVAVWKRALTVSAARVALDKVRDLVRRQAGFRRWPSRTNPT
jgi:hypothetical protein